MKVLIVNNDLVKSANLNQLKDSAQKQLAAVEPLGLRPDFHRDGKDFIYTFNMALNGAPQQLLMRDIDVKHCSTSVMISRIIAKISEAGADRLYLHFATFGHANHFKDYITVQVADRLVSNGVFSKSHIVFFTNGPQDTARFRKETEYDIFLQSCAEDVLEHIFREMGISPILNGGR